MSWRPLSEAQIWDEIKAAEVRMNAPQRRFWEAIRITPEKWTQHPYGDAGNGFWVVAIIGHVVVWYNDIEAGFNRSGYRQHGIIEDYFCNQDELEITIQQLMATIETGREVGVRCGPPTAIL